VATGVNTGTAISGLGHAVLIGWALFGGSFTAEPEPFTITEVSVISAEEFAALIAPPLPELAPVPVARPSEPVPEPEPEPAPAPPEPEPDPAPAPPPPPPPPPEPEAPAPPDTASLLAPADTPALTPGQRPRPRPVERVAPEPVPAPPDDVATAPEAQEAVTPEPADAPETVEAPREERAAEEAAREIVTEAEALEPEGGPPLASRRPGARPERPAEPDATSEPPRTAASEEEPEAEQETAALDDAVADALAAAAADALASEAPAAPPLSAAQQGALVLAIASCWNLGSLSSDALATTVVVGVEMTPDARPVAGSIRLVRFSGGTEAAARQAFEAARRAILRCGATGYNLPTEQYDQWRDIEMTFNPESMRTR
jgi:hypothetical protein